LIACSSGTRTQPPPKTAITTPVAARLRLVSASWPPFVDAAPNPRVAVELVGAALSRAGYLSDNEVAPIDEVMAELKSGNCDGSAALWKSSEREEFLLYSDAYLENRLMLVGQKGSDVGVDAFSQLKGKRIGIVEGYAYGPELDNAKEPVFVRQASTEENLRALLRGELDYVLTDALVLHQLEQHHPQQMHDRLVVGPNTMIKRTLHLALRKDLGNAQTILDAFNKALAQMLHDGSYHGALQVDWIEADIDGDGFLELVAASDHVGVEAPGKGYQLISVVSSGSDHDTRRARIVIKGVAYDSWTAVPEEFKSAPSVAPFGNKPATLRVSVFEY
jgi:polar amino acid transport system substrate-binding protein